MKFNKRMSLKVKNINLLSRVWIILVFMCVSSVQKTNGQSFHRPSFRTLSAQPQQTFRSGVRGQGQVLGWGQGQSSNDGQADRGILSFNPRRNAFTGLSKIDSRIAAPSNNGAPRMILAPSSSVSSSMSSSSIQNAPSGSQTPTGPGNARKMQRLPTLNVARALRHRMPENRRISGLSLSNHHPQTRLTLSQPTSRFSGSSLSMARNAVTNDNHDNRINQQNRHVVQDNTVNTNRHIGHNTFHASSPSSFEHVRHRNQQDETAGSQSSSRQHHVNQHTQAGEAANFQAIGGISNNAQNSDFGGNVNMAINSQNIRNSHNVDGVNLQKTASHVGSAINNVVGGKTAVLDLSHDDWSPSASGRKAVDLSAIQPVQNIQTSKTTSVNIAFKNNNAVNVGDFVNNSDNGAFGKPHVLKTDSTMLNPNKTKRRIILIRGKDGKLTPFNYIQTLSRSTAATATEVQPEAIPQTRFNTKNLRNTDSVPAQLAYPVTDSPLDRINKQEFRLPLQSSQNQASDKDVMSASHIFHNDALNNVKNLAAGNSAEQQSFGGPHVQPTYDVLAGHTASNEALLSTQQSSHSGFDNLQKVQITQVQPETQLSMLDIVNSVLSNNVQTQNVQQLNPQPHAQLPMLPSLEFNVPPPSVADSHRNPVNPLNWRLAMAQQLQLQNQMTNAGGLLSSGFGNTGLANTGVANLGMASAAFPHMGFPMGGNVLPWLSQPNMMSMGGNSDFMQEMMFGDTTDPPDIPDPTPKPSTAAPPVLIKAVPATGVAPTPTAVAAAAVDPTPVSKNSVTETFGVPMGSTGGEVEAEDVVTQKPKPKPKMKNTQPQMPKQKPMPQSIQSNTAPKKPKPVHATITPSASPKEATTTSSVHDLAEQIIAALFGPQPSTPQPPSKTHNLSPDTAFPVGLETLSKPNRAASRDAIKVATETHEHKPDPKIAARSKMVEPILPRTDAIEPGLALPNDMPALLPNDLGRNQQSHHSLEASILGLFDRTLNQADITQLAPEPAVKDTQPAQQQPEIAPFLSSNDFGGLSIQKVPKRPTKQARITGLPVQAALNEIATMLTTPATPATTTISSISLIESALNSIQSTGSNTQIFDLLNNINLLWDIQPALPQSTTKTTPTTTTTTTTPTPTTTTTPSPTTTTTTTQSSINLPVSLIEAFLKTQKQQQLQVEKCTPQSPNFVCKGKNMFSSIADIGNWCKDMCKTGSCMEVICTCSCTQPLPNKRLPNNARSQKSQQNRNRLKKANRNLRGTTTTTEEPPEEEEIEVEDMPSSTTVAYSQTTQSDWWGTVTTTSIPFDGSQWGLGNPNQVRKDNSNAHVTELPIVAWASQLKAQLDALINTKNADTAKPTQAADASLDANSAAAIASLFESLAPTTPKPPPSWRGTRWGLPPPPPKPSKQPTEEGAAERPPPSIPEWGRRRLPDTPPQRPATPPFDWGTSPRDAWGPRRSRWDNAPPPPTPTPWGPIPNRNGHAAEWGGGSRDTWRQPVPSRGGDRWGSWGEPTPAFPADPWGPRWEPPPRRGGDFRLRNKWRRGTTQSSEGGGAEEHEPPDR